MSKHFESILFTRELLIGLGESSARKSHYPELQQRLGELERFQLLLDQAPDAIFLLHGETGKVVYANATACTFCGCRREDLLGLTIDQRLTVAVERGLACPDLANISSFQSAECGLCRNDGTVNPVEILINRVELQDGYYIVIVARDITERKRLEYQQKLINEELHANYEELEALYGQIASTEELMRQKVQALEASEAALAESEARYRLAVEGAKDAIWDWDILRGHWSVSYHWLELLGLEPDPVKYITYLDAKIHPDDVAGRAAAINDHLAGKTSYYQAEYRVRSATGQWIWILSRGKALFDANGTAIRMCGSYTDITERKQQQERIVHIAFHDAVTGLPNRYSLNLALAGKDMKGGILLLDLDNFKLINDSWGHTVGDAVLVEVAGRLKTLNSSGVSVYRLGGDEFVLMSAGLGQSSAAFWAERVLELFNDPIIRQDTALAISTSIGVALYCEGISPDDILRHADIALHRAKKEGKPSWRLYEPEMEKAILERIDLEQELHQALRDEEFVLYYQPQYGLSGTVAAVESLLRWRHPVRGLVSPLSFIHVIEETGMIIPVGEWVLRTACRFGRKHLSADGTVRISVNVSALQLKQDNFTKRVLEILAQEDFPPYLLELEITETILMDSFDSNVQKLKELRGKGIRIALDDFGTGYSSLTYLNRLPIDTLKIDKSFLVGSGKTANSAIVGIIIQLAHELKLSVVAEGVETVEQLETLKKLGCDYIQGYLTSPPLPPEKAQLLINRPNLLLAKDFKEKVI